MEVKVKWEFPVCHSTSAAGSQDQPEAQWDGLLDRSHARLTPPLPFNERETCTRMHGCYSYPPTQHSSKKTRQAAAQGAPHSSPNSCLLDFIFLIASHRSDTAGWSQDTLSSSQSFNASPFGIGRVCLLNYLSHSVLKSCRPGFSNSVGR